MSENPQPDAEVDPRWAPMAAPDQGLAAAVEAAYPGLGPVTARSVYSSVNEVAEVTAGGHRYALKLYRPGVRSLPELEWEVGLQRHLAAAGTSVMAPVPGTSGGLIEPVQCDGVQRWAVLSPWVPGAKPKPSTKTYQLVGRAAAAIHAAADDWRPEGERRPSDLTTEVWDHLKAMRPLLETVGRWGQTRRLAERLEDFVAGHRLERGICHVDLTLDNVHVDGDRLWVFDFDSSAETWRAWEPQGVFHYSVLTGGPWWTDWLHGYSSVRRLSSTDQAAVPWFVLMAYFENTAWRLGLTPTSVGQTLAEADLAVVVDLWDRWVESQC